MTAKSPSIRNYEQSDQTQVAALWREVFSNDPKWNVPEQDIARKVGFQPQPFLVAVLDQQVVGTAMGGYDGHRGSVYLVAVVPALRRQGIGEALMRAIEAALSALGCTKLNLQIRAGNEAVAAFYRKLGFQVEERVSMGKRL